MSTVSNEELRRSGHIVDVVSGRIFKGSIVVRRGQIVAVEEHDCDASHVILPGFVDAHVHIESSMLPPSEFARLAVVHGTVATVSDPHEIANVLGVQGVQYMLDEASYSPLKICFGAPSCVPATSFETAGAELRVEEIRELFLDPRVGYLSEVMNYPGVLHREESVMAKIQAAQAAGRPVDGHAPGLRGDEARQYASAGISTDHECFTLEEALDKIACGMKILIREGSAAKNFNALQSLISSHPDSVMFCSDDKHPDALEAGHINEVVRRAIALGHPVMNVLRAASLQPVRHYRLSVGLLQVGDPADFIVVNDLKNMSVLETFISGACVASHGASHVPYRAAMVVNNFHARRVEESELAVQARHERIRVIVAHDGQLITDQETADATVIDGVYRTNTQLDILKIVVVNRYKHAAPAVAFVRGFGMSAGAIASSVAHDSHNVIAVGADDLEICRAINAVMHGHGGVCVVDEEGEHLLGLPIAGLMSKEDGFEVARRYSDLDRRAKALGSTLAAPFMTLSFMALLVIPHLKLSDKGLFDGDRFSFCDLGL